MLFRSIHTIQMGIIEILNPVNWFRDDWSIDDVFERVKKEVFEGGVGDIPRQAAHSRRFRAYKVYAGVPRSAAALEVAVERAQGNAFPNP